MVLGMSCILGSVFCFNFDITVMQVFPLFPTRKVYRRRLNVTYLLFRTQIGCLLLGRGENPDFVPKSTHCCAFWNT